MTDSTDPDRGRADSIEDFWTDWHEHRKNSGVPLRDIGAQVQYSHTSVAYLGQARKAQVWPDEQFMSRLLSAINIEGPEQAAWLSRYKALKKARGSTASADPPAGAPGERPLRQRRLWFASLAAALGGLAIGMAAGVFVVGPRPRAEPPQGVPVVITVDNKIALGAQDVVEDSTAAYLSTRTERKCVDHGCKVAGTEMSSGALLVAVCQVPDGPELVNYNRDTDFPDNPHRARSPRWYGIARYHDSIAFIAEIYVRAEDRGGRGLPQCPP